MTPDRAYARKSGMVPQFIYRRTSMRNFLCACGLILFSMVTDCLAQVKDQPRTDSAVQDRSGNTSLVIVTFGDSTTAPRGSVRVFSELLEEQSARMKCPIRVINAGVPGNNTRQARERIDRDVTARHPDIAILSFGINDSAVDVFKQSTEPRVPLEEYKQNLTWMVERLQKQKIRPILMTPNPVVWTDELKKLYGKPPYRPDEPDGWNVLLKNYAQAVRAVAKDRGVPLVDTYSLFTEYASRPGHNLNNLMVDGMHPSDPGHAIIANHIVNMMTKNAWRGTHSKD